MAEDIVVVVVVPYRSVIEENLFILINTKFHSILLFCANLYAPAAAPSRIYVVLHLSTHSHTKPFEFATRQDVLNCVVLIPGAARLKGP